MSRAKTSPSKTRPLSGARLARIHGDVMKLPNTYGTFVGAKSKEAHYQKSKAVVCIVQQKVPSADLQKHRRIPKHYARDTRKTGRRIATDVVAVAPEFIPQSAAVFGPGDAVRAANERATVGVALDHPDFGRCVTTAAHAFEGRGNTCHVEIRTGGALLPATAHVRPITDLVDYALVTVGAASQCANLFDDRHLIGPAHKPTEDDVGREVFVLLGNGSVVKTICRGVHARLEAPGELLTDCILTDCVTLAGDSGASLVDASWRVWGLLRGRLATTYSVFAPVHYVLARERARLINA